MQLITTYELQRLTETELSVLFRRANEALTKSALQSAERRNVLATLENVTRRRVTLSIRF